MGLILFYKATKLNGGERWITLHPNGPDEKGVPVLIQPNSDGSAHVIGGAGGSLSYLKLRNVRSESEYAKEAGEKRAKKTAEKKEQVKKDKEAGIYQSKTKAKENVRTQTIKAQSDFVKQVADKLGWDKSKMVFPEDSVANVSDAAANKARDKFHRNLLKQAHDAVDDMRQHILKDADARLTSGLQEVPVTSEDDTVISVQDLDPVPTNTGGLGFSTKYGERAKKGGELPQAIEQAKEVRDQDKTPEQLEARIRRGATAKAVAAELKGLRDPSQKLKEGAVDMTKAVELMQAEKKLKAVAKKARDAMAEIEDSDVEPKAYVIAADEEPAEGAVEEDLTNDLRTIKTKAFLSEYKKIGGGDDTLGKFIGIGAFNSVNALALAVSGDALVDRSVVDVLGISGAAEVLARRLKADLSPAQATRVAEAMQDYHLNSYMETAQASLDEAHKLMETAKGMAVTDLSTGTDIKAAQEINRQHGEAILAAQTKIGEALGELEGNAALVVALKRPGNKPFTVSLGKTPLEQGVTQAQALGLKRGDYSFENQGGSLFLTVTPDGMGKLAKPVNRADIEQVQRNLGIMNGDQDEDNWLPQGFADRPDLVMKVKPGVAARLAQPFKPSADMEQSLRDYIGGRAADGDNPADIMADLQSQDFTDKAGDPKAYQEALDAVAPLHGSHGQILRAEDMAPAFDEMADKFVESRYGGARSTINRQQLKLDDNTADALHRALAETPAGVSAYKPIGELDKTDQRNLREHFQREIAKESPETLAKRAELDKHLAAEPARQSQDMFGDMAENPEWREWSTKKDTLSGAVNAGELTWDKYIGAMHGPEKAYESMQDLIKSKVHKSFAGAYNSFNPDSPIKVGRQSIRNNLGHLDMVDPQARAKRMAADRARIDALRERSQGRYSSGSVAEKIDAARAREEAFKQSQMGFFSSESEDAPEPTDAPLGADERHSLGHIAERQIAGMMDKYGKGFDPKQPVKMFQPNMSGPTNAPRQRLIKLMEANKRVVAAFGTGSGKAQPLHSKLLTPTGWRRMGDIKVGDEIIAGNGSIAFVTGVFPQGRKPIFRVIFEDGGQTECCDEHLWLTQTERERHNFRRQADCDGQVRPLLEIMKRLKGSQDKLNHSIPICGEVLFKPSPVPIDPYLIGLLLGDGGLSGLSVKFSCADQEIIDAVSKLLPDGVRAVKQPGNNCDYALSTKKGGRNTRPFLTDMKALGLMGTVSNSKFVPAIYKVNDATVRLAVLQGLMDTDGTVSQKGTGVTFCTVSKALCDDVIFLVQSLGGIARISTRTPMFKHKGETKKGQLAYNVAICLPASINPFRLTRKAVLVVPKTTYAPVKRYIKEVQAIGEMRAQCIAISHPSRLYVTDDFIVTHNTAIQLGAFSHLKSKGKANRGLFLVPSVVQGQFGGAALQFLKPGQFNWHIKPGASQAERIAAYKDPKHDFCAMTHSAFRQDMIHLGAVAAGVSESQMSQQLNDLPPAGKKAWMKDLMAKEGINFDFLTVDEGQATLNRAGKEDSSLANVVDSLSANTPYYMMASADPVKNDSSEIYDLAHKMDPERYQDRDAFMRRYGADTVGSKDALRREMARYMYPSKIDPDIKVDRKDAPSELSAGQHVALAELDKHIASMYLANMEGRVDVDAARAVSPAAFKGVAPENYEKIAKDLQRNTGLLRSAAVQRVINTHPDNPGMDTAVKMANDRKGQPGVVFAHSLEAVKMLSERLSKEGHKVITITGSDNAEQKEQKRAAYQKGEGDVLVASDAAAVGMNVQRGQWCYQFDVPQTAMLSAQRSGRINRIGQKNDVELIEGIVNHPEIHRARERLVKKFALRDLMTTPLDTLDESGIAYYLKQRSVYGTESISSP